ncbi:MAG: hypothetical protein U9N84_05200 [Actinomycetota bacterium]|nr:hypothetical protein [Actinomycetota bacterium]
MADLESDDTTSSRALRRWLFATTWIVVGLLIVGGWWLLRDTGPVDAASADPEVVFDGTRCTYEGPAEIAGGGVTFALNNTSAIPIRVVLFQFDERSEFEAELEYLAVGADAEVNPGELPVGGVVNTVNTVQSGSSLRSLEALHTGLYTIDCVRVPTASTAPDYVWRAGTIRVVP